MLHKVPINHSSLPFCPSWADSASATCKATDTEFPALLRLPLCSLLGSGDSLLTMKNGSSGLEVAENILTYLQGTR